MSAPKPKVLAVAGPELQVYLPPPPSSHVTLTPSRAHEAWESISHIADIVTPKSTDRASFIAECQAGSLDGIIAMYRSMPTVSVTGRIDAELLAALPSSLKYICHIGESSSVLILPFPTLTLPEGAGYDQIDIPACTGRGIRVSNTPSAVDDATADTAIWLMLGALRNFNMAMTSLRAGTWSDERAVSRGHDPQGKVLGVLGMGGIGRNMAAKARAFGMSVRYHNRTKLSAEDEDGAEYVSFEKLLAESDVLSLNLPLNVSCERRCCKPVLT